METDEEIQARKNEEWARKNKILIEFYLLEFPNELKVFKLIDLENRTHDELRLIHSEIDRMLALINRDRMIYKLENAIMKFLFEQKY